MKKFFSYGLVILGIFLLAISGKTDIASAQGDEREFSPEKTLEKVKFYFGGLPFELHGFFEGRGGARTEQDLHESKTVTLGETRLQIHFFKSFDWVKFRMKMDFFYDGVEESGLKVDFREVYIAFSPFGFMEIKLGRQILTWGTGDNIFINDLFPKDFTSFFIGREDEYMKAPSDGLKLSFYSLPVNINIIYIPKFNSDRFIDGKRLSYFNPQLGKLAGEDAVIHPSRQDEWFNDSEFAYRLYRELRGYNLCLYGYHGFWKNPVGFDYHKAKAFFPRLNVYGVSARGGVLYGIGNVEMAYYESKDDLGGRDPFLPNSQFRFLLGYEQEVAKDFTVGSQYYLEQMMDYNAYRQNLPQGNQSVDRCRHTFTLRLTKLLMYQNLKLSLFTMYSPSDQDAWVRPNIHYKINDQWSTETGANIFVGKKDYTFLGQFKKNTNIYVALRWSF